MSGFEDPQKPANGYQQQGYDQQPAQGYQQPAPYQQQPQMTPYGVPAVHITPYSQPYLPPFEVHDQVLAQPNGHGKKFAFLTRTCFLDCWLQTYKDKLEAARQRNFDYVRRRVMLDCESLILLLTTSQVACCAHAPASVPPPAPEIRYLPSPPRLCWPTGPKPEPTLLECPESDAHCNAINAARLLDDQAYLRRWATTVAAACQMRPSP